VVAAAVVELAVDELHRVGEALVVAIKDKGRGK
jgi:hypothetical protein